MPMAASRLMAPVGMAATLTRVDSAPIRMMEPLPQLLLDLRDGEAEGLAAIDVEPGFVSGHDVLRIQRVTGFTTLR